MATGPDQGLAWFIALACFFINFIMAGLARTAGVLYVAIIDLYDVSRAEATTPFSIRVCVRNMTGPLIGLLGQKYGIRGVTTLGGLVAALGSILCYFAPNVFWITMFWGVIHGIGFGLSTVLHMMVVGQYFEKYKASALGLAFSGDCFGTFAFPVIMETLFSKYDIRGTFLILGGIVLNVIPMALLLKKPPWIRDNNQGRKLKKSAIDNLQQDIRKNNEPRDLSIKTDYSSTANLGILNTINETEQKMDYLTVSDNMSDDHKFVAAKSPLGGHYNKAFQSSETNLTTLVKRTDVKKSILKNSRSSVSLCTDTKIRMTPPFQQSNSAENLTTDIFQSSDMSSRNTNMNGSNICKSSCRPRLDVRTSRSVCDLNIKNESNSRSPRLNKLRHESLSERRESLPPVCEKKVMTEEDCKIFRCNDDRTKECDDVGETESPRIDGPYTQKRRTSSFVGQVAHEIVSRMRTASFASTMTQDCFVTPMAQESESESEQEFECQLKSIVEHKDHDIENCTSSDLVLSIDKNMMDDYFKEFPDEPVIEPEKPKPPTIFKLMVRTNTKPMFILISVSMAVYAFLFVGVLTIIIDYAVDQGISNEQGKYLIIDFSVADLFGRLTFGQVIDRNMMKMKNYAGCTMLIMGAVVAAIPLNKSFNYMIVCMCMYGFVQGGTAIMFPILINMYMDKNCESVAMGCLNFYGGLLMLLMAPMIGYFRDNTGSYNGVFHIIGGLVAVVGIAWQFEPMIVKFQNKKLREKYIMREISMMQQNQ